MRILITILLISILFSCKKKDKVAAEISQCNSSYIAFEYIGNDSTSLVGIDTNTGGIIRNLFDFPLTFAGGGVFNSYEKCYVNFQKDSSGKMHFMRFDLEKNKTDIIRYSGALDHFAKQFAYRIMYVDTMGKYYYAYNDYSGLRIHKLFEIVLSGDSCTDQEIDLPPNSGLNELMVNQSTAEICYWARGKYNRYNTLTGEVLGFVPGGFATSLHSHVYNPNDEMFYGISRSSVRADLFCKVNPLTGEATVVDTLDEYPYDDYISCTFDVCKNQFVIQRGAIKAGVLPTNVYWLDISTGKEVKHIATHDMYNDFNYYK